MRQTKRKNFGKSLGFTLVELAIVLTVLGIISTMGVQAMSIMSEQKKVADTKKKLDDIEIALISYFNLYGHLPCPAARNTAETSSDFGKAPAGAECNQAVGAFDMDDVDVDGTPADNVRIGVAPVVALGLPKTHMYDGWGNRITYATIKELAVNEAGYNSFTNSTGETHGIIRVNDRSGNQLSPAHASAIIPYILVSHGKDKKGAYNNVGNTSGVTCTGTNLDKENCDEDDAIFIAESIFDVEGEATFFDDYVRYKTKDLFETEAGLLNVTSSTGGTPDAPVSSIQYNANGTDFGGDAGLVYTSTGGLVGNDDGNDVVDFRWETDNNTHAFFIEAVSDALFYGASDNSRYATATHNFVGNVAFAETSADLPSATGDKIYLSFSLKPTVMIIDSATVYSYLDQHELKFNYGATSKEAILGYGALTFEDSNVVKTNISSSYVNFDSTSGASGYGIRDNSGVVQYKDSGGSWTDIKSGTVLAYASGAIGTGSSFDLNFGGVNTITTLTCFSSGTTTGASGTKCHGSENRLNPADVVRNYYCVTMGAGGTLYSSSTSIHETTSPHIECTQLNYSMTPATNRFQYLVIAK